MASDHYDNGEFDKLVEYCEERALKWKGNPFPVYWLARAKYKKGELESSKELFEKVLVMEPEWESSVTLHLTKVNEALSSLD